MWISEWFILNLVKECKSDGNSVATDIILDLTRNKDNIFYANCAYFKNYDISYTSLK